jgi:hypothetical protein
MPWPFVSRERFDEERVRREKAESDLEVLREKFLDYLERHPAALPVIGADTDLSKIQPISGRPTIANVIATANRDAYAAAQVPGAKGIAAQLEEARTKLFKIKKAANGG